MHLRPADRLGREAPEFLLQRPQRFPCPGSFRIEPHAPVAVFPPRACTQIQRNVGARVVEMRGCGQRTNSALQIDLPVELFDEINSLEPPVPEQLGVERSCDQLCPLTLHSVSNATDQSCEMLRMTLDLSAGLLRLVRKLVSKAGSFRGDTPQLEPARIANLVELQVCSVARVAAVSRPQLQRRERVANDRPRPEPLPVLSHPVRTIR